MDLKQQRQPQDADFANYLFLKADSEEGEEINCEAEIITCLREIINLEIKSRMGEISQNIRTAEGGNDLDKVPGLMQKFKEISGKLVNS